MLREFDNIEEMNQRIIDNWNRVVNNNDKVYHLGDVAFANFTRIKEIFDQLNGEKVLIKGNHDTCKLGQYAQIFKDVRATHALDGIVLSHIPVHPMSLDRWRGNVHGHLHSNVVGDPKYYNVCVEQINYTPVEFGVIQRYFDANSPH
jgi:calcineurin-like phosphoesterase family protein